MSHLRPITLGLQLQLPYNWNEMKKYKSINIRLKIAACVLFHQSITFLKKHIQENSDDSSSLQTSNISENFFFPMAPLPCGCKRVRNDVYQKTRAGETRENLSYPSQNLSFSFGPEFKWPVQDYVPKTASLQNAYRVTLQIIWPVAVTVTRHTAILGVIEGILFTPVTQPARNIRLAVTRASHVVADVTDGANRRTVTTWIGVKHHDVRWLKTMLLSNLTAKTSRPVSGLRPRQYYAGGVWKHPWNVFRPHCSRELSPAILFQNTCVVLVPFSKCCVHKKTHSRRFQIPQVWRAFKKS